MPEVITNTIPTNVKNFEKTTKDYSRVQWQNAITPLNQDNLNNMDIGIKNLETCTEELIKTVNEEIDARTTDVQIIDTLITNVKNQVSEESVARVDADERIQQSIDDLQTKAQKLDEKDGELQGKLDAVTNAIGNTNANVTTIGNKVTSLSTQVDNIDEKVATLEDTVPTDLKTSVETLQTNVTTLQGDVKTLQTNVTNLQDTVNSLVDVGVPDTVIQTTDDLILFCGDSTTNIYTKLTS